MEVGLLQIKLLGLLNLNDAREQQLKAQDVNIPQKLLMVIVISIPNKIALPIQPRVMAAPQLLPHVGREPQVVNLVNEK